MPYMREGKCVYHKNPDGSRGKKKGCSASASEAEKYMRALYAHENKSMAEFSMVITKASIPDKKSRTMRLSMVTSDTGEDAYEERMSTELFEDFIQRIDNNLPVPEPFDGILEEGWNGGMPYPSISHYRSGKGTNVPGEIERVYVDGDKLKANAVLHDSPLGQAVWKSVCQDIEDREKPLEERAFENPVRISIGFLDLEHKHELEDEEDYIFTRSDIKNKCEKCAEGVNHKVYLKGQLVHLAFTRVPANPRTSVEVLRMETDEVIKTKKDDAKSIIGDLADELVGKSTVENDALVIRAEMDYEEYAREVKHEFSKQFSPPPQPSLYVRSVTDKNVFVVEYNYDSEDGYGHSKIYKVGYSKKDNEISFDERSKWVEMEIGLMPKKSKAHDVEWEVEYEIEKPVEKSNSTVLKPEVIMEKEIVQEETPVVEEEKSALDLAFEALKSKIVESKGKGSAAYADLQPILNQFGNTVKNEVANPVEMSAEVTRAMIREELQAAFPEFAKQLVSMLPAVAQPVQKSEEVPQARSLFINRNVAPQTKEMTQIEKLAYNTTIGTVTGQKVE